MCGPERREGLPVGDDGFARVERTDLAAEAASWSGLPFAEIDAAIDTLLLTGQHLSALGSHDVAEVESRAYRLGFRPLPVIDGQLLIAPWLVNAAIDIYANYLGDSRLPYPPDVLSSGILETMEQHRQKRNKKLETDVRTVVAELDLPHRFRFTEEDAKIAGIPRLLGEIDLLIADPEHDRLWVCEVKDPHDAVSPRTIAKHIERFSKNKGEGRSWMVVPTNSNADPSVFLRPMRGTDARISTVCPLERTAVRARWWLGHGQIRDWSGGFTRWVR